MKAAITGGAGRQCLATIYDFIECDDVEKILLIDINEEALDKRRELVNSTKVVAQKIDLRDTKGLAKLLEEYDVVINASSHVFNMDVMNACRYRKLIKLYKNIIKVYVSFLVHHVLFRTKDYSSGLTLQRLKFPTNVWVHRNSIVLMIKLFLDRSF